MRVGCADSHYTAAVGELGSIFETEHAEDLPRGEDLTIEVEVPRTALGHPRGHRVPLARVLEVDGRSIERVVQPGDSDVLPLFLPETFASGSVLRLRGQGGVRADGRPGDLYVKVRVVDPPPVLASALPTALAPVAKKGGGAALFVVILGMIAWLLVQMVT